MEIIEKANVEPAILTANTFYWTPATSAGQRRRNEERNQQLIADYFESLGFSVTRSCDNVVASKDNVDACFSYSETCNNVYKSLSVSIGGKRSNITAIRKIAREVIK